MGEDRSMIRHIQKRSAATRPERLAQDAEHLLEGPMSRQRWTPEVRDAIAAHIDRVVQREIQIAFPGRRSE